MIKLYPLLTRIAAVTIINLTKSPQTILITTSILDSSKDQQRNPPTLLLTMAMVKSIEWSPKNQSTSNFIEAGQEAAGWVEKTSSVKEGRNYPCKLTPTLTKMMKGEGNTLHLP